MSLLINLFIVIKIKQIHKQNIKNNYIGLKHCCNISQLLFLEYLNRLETRISSSKFLEHSEDSILLL